MSSLDKETRFLEKTKEEEEEHKRYHEGLLGMRCHALTSDFN